MQNSRAPRTVQRRKDGLRSRGITSRVIYVSAFVILSWSGVSTDSTRLSEFYSTAKLDREQPGPIITARVVSARRAREDSVRPRHFVSASGRPLNFTVSGHSETPCRSCRRGSVDATLALLRVRSFNSEQN